MVRHDRENASMDQDRRWLGAIEMNIVADCRLFFACALVGMFVAGCRTSHEEVSGKASLRVMRGRFLGREFIAGDHYATVNYRITAVEHGPAPTNDVISIVCTASTLPDNGPAREAILVLVPLFPSTTPQVEWAGSMFRCVGGDAHYGILADVPANRERAEALLSGTGDNIEALRMSMATAINYASNYLTSAEIPFKPDALSATRCAWGFGWTVLVISPDQFDWGILVEVSDDGRVRSVVGAEH